MLFDRDDGVVTLCEIKYTKEPIVIDKAYAENLKNKISAYKTQTGSKKQIHLAFISANGIKENVYGDALVDQVVTLDSLMD